jgi:GAF domain-containing protein
MRKRQAEREAPPFVSPYRQVLDQFGRKGKEAPLRRRLSELVSLLELTTTLSSGLARAETLDAALAIVTRELQVARGAFFVRSEDGALVLRASCGLPPGAASTPGLAAPRDGFMALGPGDEAHDRHAGHGRKKGPECDPGRRAVRVIRHRSSPPRWSNHDDDEHENASEQDE